MPRIRYLKPEFFDDEDLGGLPPLVRIFYAGLWCWSDKEGRLQDRPKRLKADILPYDDADADQFLSILAKPKAGSGQPFIHRYESGGQRYIQIIAWDQHQKPHHTEKESTIPAPPDPKESSPQTPLEERSKGMGKIKQLNPSTELSNGEITVKERTKLQLLDFVRLTEAEYEKLIEQFGREGADDRIRALNDGIGSKGYKYKSHYHTILSWERKNLREKKARASTDGDVEVPLVREADGRTPRERFMAEMGIRSI
jgi:hypothetical protein